MNAKAKQAVEQLAEPILQAKGLTVERDGMEVLHDIDLALRPGEITVVLGPNGAGKSTLVAALAGLLPATSGSIERSGRVAAALQTPALARRTVVANVEAALSWWGSKRSGRRERALEALASTGARDLADRPSDELSGGEARRVHLARVLAVGAEVVLLDEPFAGLDSATRGDLIYDVGGALRDPDRATLIVAHDRSEAWALADQVVVIMDGRIAAAGPPSEVLNTPPSLEVAGFLGFTGRLRQRGNRVLALRPGDVRLDERGPFTAAVTRRSPIEDGVRLDLELPEGSAVCITLPPGPEPGEVVRVRTIGGVSFEQPAG